MMTNPVVTIKMENGDCDERRSYIPDIAPNTVNNLSLL